MNSSAAGKKGIKEGKSAEGLRRLLEKHVLSNTAKEAMKEMRAAMNDDPEVAAVLQGQRLNLLKKFNSIASKRAADPTKKKKQAAAQWGKVRGLAPLMAHGAQAAANETSMQQLQANELVLDMDATQLIVDLKVAVIVDSKTPPTVTLSRSQLSFAG